MDLIIFRLWVNNHIPLFSHALIVPGLLAHSSCAFDVIAPGPLTHWAWLFHTHSTSNLERQIAASVAYSRVHEDFIRPKCAEHCHANSGGPTSLATNHKGSRRSTIRLHLRSVVIKTRFFLLIFGKYGVLLYGFHFSGTGLRTPALSIKILL